MELVKKSGHSSLARGLRFSLLRLVKKAGRDADRTDMKVKLICSVCAKTGAGEILWQDEKSRVVAVRTAGYFLDAGTAKGAVGGWFCSRYCLEARGRLVVKKELPTSRQDEPMVAPPVRKEDLH